MIQEFHHPTTVSEAVGLRKRIRGSLYYAGGTGINSRVWPCRPTGIPTCAIMLDKLPLRALETSPAGVTIGSGVTVQELVDGPGVPPMLRAAAGLFANRNVRCMGTLGGNVAGASSCSNITPTLLALDTRITIEDASGERTEPLADYLARQDLEAIIVSFTIPAGFDGRRWAVRKHGRTANDVSLVSVGVSCGGDTSRVERPIVAVNGAVSRATRLTALEQRLEGKPLPQRDEIDALVKTLVDPVADLRGSVAFKRHLAAVLVSDALMEAVGRKG